MIFLFPVSTYTISKLEEYRVKPHENCDFDSSRSFESGDQLMFPLSAAPRPTLWDRSRASIRRILPSRIAAIQRPSGDQVQLLSQVPPTDQAPASMPVMS